MKMETNLKIFTLNCWGIMGMTKHRKERFTAIAQYLSSRDYDFVFLQEVWCLSDFETIVRKTKSNLPYSHYFHSGVFGSGVCILSKSPFIDVALHTFSLNGFVHKIHHGDWFGGKAVGLCRVFYKGLNISLYISHHHAEYNRVQDQYLAHRIVQAFEMSQFTRLTSETADLTILAGDFNTEPNDIAYRIILHNTGCLDAFLEQTPSAEGESKDPTFGMTCGNPRNVYTTAAELKEAPNGKRIDFIMYKTKEGTSIQCHSCVSPIDKIPEHGGRICYSDHEALEAKLTVYKSSNAHGSANSIKSRIAALNDGLEIIKANLKSLQGDRLFYILAVIISLCVLILTFPVSRLFDSYQAFFIILRVLLLGVVFLAVWLGIVVFRSERSATVAAYENIQLLLDALRAQNDTDTSKENDKAFHNNVKPDNTSL